MKNFTLYFIPDQEKFTRYTCGHYVTAAGALLDSQHMVPWCHILGRFMVCDRFTGNRV